jgi:hypothetical protein
MRKVQRGKFPVKRLGRADEIAGMVSYLASAETAFMTGPA